MKVLLLHLDATGRDAIADSLREDGHDVHAAASPPSPGFVPAALVVCLDSQPQRTLDLAGRVGAESGVAAASILFVGGTHAAMQEAQRRFPRASFARLDALSTALASMDV
jgi:hypothetical protein